MLLCTCLRISSIVSVEWRKFKSSWICYCHARAGKVFARLCKGSRDSCSVDIHIHQQLLKKKMYEITARHNYIIKKPNPKGSFSSAIPLEYIFGFCEDYDKVMYGLRHTLTLGRTSDNDAIFKPAALGDAGNEKLSKKSWMMPRVQPNDEMRYKLYKSIESKSVLDAAFRMRQCNIVEIP